MKTKTKLTITFLTITFLSSLIWNILIFAIEQLITLSTTNQEIIKHSKFFLLYFGIINSIFISIAIAYHLTPKVINFLNPNNHETTKEN